MAAGRGNVSLLYVAVGLITLLLLVYLFMALLKPEKFG
jgi:K+-transporting ATPase KdpF subunit